MIRRALAGAKETISNTLYVRASNKKSKQNLDLASIQVASKKFNQSTGRKFSPSIYRSELTLGSLSGPYRQYEKDKKAARKDYKNRFGL